MKAAKQFFKPRLLPPLRRVPLAPAVVAAILAASAWSLQAAQPWTLARAGEFAMTNSPDARIASHRIDAARAELHAAQAAFRPRVSFQSGYIRTDNPVSVFGAALNQRSYSSGLDFNDVPDADNLNLKGLITMPLYTGGRNEAAKAVAAAGQAAAHADAETVRSVLSFEIAQAYFNITKAAGFIRASEAAITAFRKNLEVARDRVESGAALKTDVLDLEVRLAQAQEDLVRARNARALTKRAIRTLMGWEEPEFEVADEPVWLLAPLVGDGTTGRPELEAAAQRRTAAEQGVRQSRAGFLPTLSGFGSVDYDRGWEFDGDGTSYTVGVLLEWNLWDGARTRANVEKARTQLAEAREAERKLSQALDLEAEQARLRLTEADERITVTERAEASAQESVKLTRARYKEGLSLATQLIDAETALTGAQVRREEARADREIAIAALRKALGLPVVTFNKR